MAKWIGFTEARHLIEDHAERSNLGATPVAAAHYIYDSLISLMIDGVVKSRSRVPSSFRLHFTSNIDPKSFQIDADDYLPIIFWISWRDVIEEAQKGMMSGHNQDAYFSSEGDMPSTKPSPKRWASTWLGSRNQSVAFVNSDTPDLRGFLCPRLQLQTVLMRENGA